MNVRAMADRIRFGPAAGSPNWARGGTPDRYAGEGFEYVDVSDRARLSQTYMPTYAPYAQDWLGVRGILDGPHHVTNAPFRTPWFGWSPFGAGAPPPAIAVTDPLIDEGSFYYMGDLGLAAQPGVDDGWPWERSGLTGGT